MSIKTPATLLTLSLVIGAIVGIACTANTVTAQAEREGLVVPFCVNEPFFKWECWTIPTEVLALSAQLFSENCKRPALLAMYETSEDGVAFSYQVLTEDVANCVSRKGAEEELDKLRPSWQPE